MAPKFSTQLISVSLFLLKALLTEQNKALSLKMSFIYLYLGTVYMTPLSVLHVDSQIQLERECTN